MKPQEAEQAINRFLRIWSTNTLHRPNTFTATAEYERDPRFKKLFDEKIDDLAAIGLNREDMQVLGEWNEIRKKVQFLRDIYKVIERHLPPEKRTKISYEITEEIALAKDYESRLTDVQDQLSQVLYFETNVVQRDILLFTSLQSLHLGLPLSNFPEFLTGLSSLKKLEMRIKESSEVPESIIQMKALEELRLRGANSLDFVVNMPNVKKVYIYQNLDEAFSPEVLDKLKFRKDLLLFPEKIFYQVRFIIDMAEGVYFYEIKLRDELMSNVDKNKFKKNKVFEFRL